MFLILQLCVEHVGQSCFASACVSLFSNVFGSVLSRDSWTIFGHSLGFSSVSASVEHALDQPSPCLCRSGAEFILNQDRECHTWFFFHLCTNREA